MKGRNKKRAFCFVPARSNNKRRHHHRPASSPRLRPSSSGSSFHRRDNNVVLSYPSPFHQQSLPSLALEATTPASISIPSLFKSFSISQPATITMPYIITFIAGGLFFSIFISAIAAFRASGFAKLKKLFNLSFVTLRNALEILSEGLGGALNAIKKGKGAGRAQRKRRRQSLAQGWKVFRQSLSELQARALGRVNILKFKSFSEIHKTGLIAFQYMADRMTPYIFARNLEMALKDALENIHNDNIGNLTVTEFDIGPVPPKLRGARVYDVGKDAMAFDVDVLWQSQLETKIDLVTKRLGLEVPVVIRNIGFEGIIRLQFTPLIKSPPGFGAILLSLASDPKIDADVEVYGGAVTNVPWVRSEILGAVRRVVAETMVWPQRLVIPSLPPDRNALVLEVSELRRLQNTTTEDPFSKAELEVERQQEREKTTYGNLEENEDFEVRKVINIVVENEKDSAFEALDHDKDGLISKDEYENAIELEEIFKTKHQNEEAERIDGS